MNFVGNLKYRISKRKRVEKRNRQSIWMHKLSNLVPPIDRPSSPEEEEPIEDSEFDQIDKEIFALMDRRENPNFIQLPEAFNASGSSLKTVSSSIHHGEYHLNEQSTESADSVESFKGRSHNPMALNEGNSLNSTPPTQSGFDTLDSKIEAWSSRTPITDEKGQLKSILAKNVNKSGSSPMSGERTRSSTMHAAFFLALALPFLAALPFDSRTADAEEHGGHGGGGGGGGHGGGHDGGHGGHGGFGGFGGNRFGGRGFNRYFGGRATYYTGWNTRAGSCGYIPTVDNVVALSPYHMPGACGRCVMINHGGMRERAFVTDTCIGCAENALDMSNMMFGRFGLLSQGALNVDWEFADC